MHVSLPHAGSTNQQKNSAARSTQRDSGLPVAAQDKTLSMGSHDSYHLLIWVDMMKLWTFEPAESLQRKMAKWWCSTFKTATLSVPSGTGMIWKDWNAYKLQSYYIILVCLKIGHPNNLCFCFFFQGNQDELGQPYANWGLILLDDKSR